jgi:hypothetical protein
LKKTPRRFESRARELASDVRCERARDQGADILPRHHSGSNQREVRPGAMADLTTLICARCGLEKV